MSCNVYEVFYKCGMMSHLEDSPIKNAVQNGQSVYRHNFSHSLIGPINLFTHLVIVSLTLAMAWKCWIMEFKKTALHAHLCTLGFVCLMAEGMMVRYHGNVLFYGLTPLSQTLVHSILQVTGGLLGIGGTLQKYWGKELHFKSRHGKFGLAACILCFLNLLLGLAGLIVPQSLAFLRILHSFMGLATFIVGMLAQIFGYDTGFMKRNFTKIHLYKFFTLVILVLSCIGPFKIVVHKLYKLFT